MFLTYALLVADIPEQITLLAFHFIPLTSKLIFVALISLLVLEDKELKEELLEEVLSVWELVLSIQELDEPLENEETDDEIDDLLDLELLEYVDLDEELELII